MSRWHVAVALAALTSMVAVGAYYFAGPSARLPFKRNPAFTTTVDGAALAPQLVKLAREGSESDLREWLKAQGPEATLAAVRALDNSHDPTGSARMSALRAIESLGSDLINDERRGAWGAALRELAQTVLNDGPERAHYLGKAVQMEGSSQ